MCSICIENISLWYAVGEVIGTGIIGSLLCIPMAWVLGMQDFFVKPLMIAFIISSFIGFAISYFLLIMLKKRGLLDRFKNNSLEIRDCFS